MYYTEEIIEYAKELYLTPDADGRHKYSLRDIATKMRQKFDKDIHFETIRRWALRFGWDKLWEQAVREGITEAITESSQKTKEEQIKEAIANRKKQDFVFNTNLRLWAYEFIKNNGFDNIRDALMAYEIASKNLRDIQLLEEVLPVVKVEFIDTPKHDEDK